ncbi:MAG: PAS domain-containing protein [Alphaproteobacteria bacterium]
MKITPLITDADLATVQNEDFRRIHAYWAGKRGSRAMPSRADIAFDELKEFEPNLLLVSVEGEPPQFHFDEFGDKVVSLFGENPEGHGLNEYAGKGAEIIRAGYIAVVEQKRPLRQWNFGSFGMDAAAPVLRYERVLLPLSDDGDRVDAILVLSYQAPL